MSSNKKRVTYSVEEVKYIAEHIDTHSYGAIVKLVNHKFWKDKEVRTYESVRNLVRSGEIIPRGNRHKTVQNSIHSIPDFTVVDKKSELQPVEDLISERIKKYDIKRSYKSSFIEVKVNHNKPIGIAHFGDPHVDDDGTDLATLFHHVEIIKKTEGLFGGNIGDNTNNWIGRLGSLYGEQSTSSKESWQLCEHFIRSINWLYLIGGNHDAWSGAGDPLDWICGDSLYTKHGTRLKLVFPNKREVFISPRHQWRGNSMWNTTHAISRSAQMGLDDNILVGGHTHVSGYQIVKNHKSQNISHCIQVASYKTMDSYAEKLGLEDKNIFTCPVTIINPFAKKEIELVHTCFDPEMGADYLTYLRRKYE